MIRRVDLLRKYVPYSVTLFKRKLGFGLLLEFYRRSIIMSRPADLYSLLSTPHQPPR